MSASELPKTAATRRSEEQSKELDELRSEMETFTYTVSHELKGPLHTIKGFVDVILDEQANGHAETLKDDLIRIRDAADVLQAQLEGLLHLSRLGRRRFAPAMIPIDRLRGELVARWASTVASVGGSLLLQGEVAGVWADETSFMEMLGYLIENSIAFRSPDRCLRIEVSIGCQGGLVTGWVQDNGLGILAPHREAVFQVFKKLDPHSPGKGMGLVYARKIASMHGGRLWVGEQGQPDGVCMKFELPSATAEEVRNGKA